MGKISRKNGIFLGSHLVFPGFFGLCHPKAPKSGCFFALEFRLQPALHDHYLKVELQRTVPFSASPLYGFSHLSQGGIYQLHNAPPRVIAPGELMFKIPAKEMQDDFHRRAS
jgi:hypothetical protein